ncbi:winged helix DNA-binding domain-containing protein, partial [Klebsiella pneumoniae]|nr:winged helix DNA-binding domain-containing protein [Klebsiella pneumoniae]
MDHYRARRGTWLELPPDEQIQQVLVEVAARGPSTARDLDDGRPRSKEHWGWNWSEARKSLDWLFMIGELAIVGRTSQFEVVY